MPPTTPIELKRHYRELSEKETDEVVEAVADLMVNFLEGKRDSARGAEGSQERTHERDLKRQADSR